MTYSCHFCPSTFSTPGNKSRHEARFHPCECGSPRYQCSICESSARKMSPLEEHMRTVHSKFTNCCPSCHLGFNNFHLYAQHKSSVHSLLVFGEEFQPLQIPSQSSFNGHLQTFVMEAENNEENSLDLQTFMQSKRAQIEAISEQKLCSGPQKIQFSAELSLFKPKHETDEDDENLVIFANSLMTPIIAGGISNDDFALMVEKMLAVFFTFVSSRSGWLLDRVIRLHLNFANYRPIRGSLFIALPCELSTCQAVLIIQNHNEINCFVYYDIAARCLKENIGIKADGQNDILRATNPETYKDLKSLFPAGNIQMMPMGLSSLNKFEELNSVQVNVSDFHKKIYFFYEFEQKTVQRNWLLIYCYDSDKNHYVLNKDLCKFFCFLWSVRYRSYLILCRNCFRLCLTASHLSMNTLNCAKIIHQPLFECPAKTAIYTNSTTYLPSGLPH